MTRMLIIDDHEMVRRGLKQILAERFRGSEICEAGDARVGLEMVVAQEWDVVLLDINLPGRSGLEILGEIKRVRPATPVLVVSGYPEEEYAIRSLKNGASGYLHKSSAADEVLLAVQKALAGQKYVTAPLAEKLALMLSGEVERAPHEGLSNREIQILRMVASGRTMKEIASELSLSEKTIGTYRTRISAKTGLATVVDLTRYAMRHGLVD